jgi:hypothetical protein
MYDEVHTMYIPANQLISYKVKLVNNSVASLQSIR